MTAWLQLQGHAVNRMRVQRLMRRMGLEVIYQRPRTSRAAPGHRIYPYLLRGLCIQRVHQVWAADITYIPIGLPPNFPPVISRVRRSFPPPGAVVFSVR